MDKQPTSFKLTPEVRALLKSLSKRLGISQAGVIEIAVRKLAEQRDKE